MNTNKEQIIKAVDLLRQGRLVVFPTDTVYGLGADATCEAAILSVFALKKRSLGCPLIVHIPNIKHLSEWVDPEYLKRDELFVLAEKFWPGPLTIVVKKAAKVSNVMTSGQNTIAIRIPNHPIALELLKNFNSGIVGTSANLSDHNSPTTFEQVFNVFGDQVFMLDGGPCNFGIESTIVSLVEKPVILRQGVISLEELQGCLG